jgi:hypothetical protein
MRYRIPPRTSRSGARWPRRIQSGVQVSGPLPSFPTRRRSTIFSPIVRRNSEACRTVGSNRGHATTDTDIRFKSRFETSGEFHRDIPPPTPRSEATVCAVTGGNIAELAATAFVAPLIVLLSVRTIGYRGEQCGGGESVSQPPLKQTAFSTLPDQNPPVELRQKIDFASDKGRHRPVIDTMPSSN